jgi:subtilisin-like proprotein convertase family protein
MTSTLKLAIGNWKPAILAWLLSLPLASPAALYNFTGPFNNNGAGNSPGVIPDNDPIGLTDSHTISGLGNQIANITVTLNISGGWNGDLYAYLRLNNGPMVVLLDRVGMTSSNPDGYGDTGFQVTLSETASHDIHFYQNYSPSYNGSGQLMGTWQADGRTDPLSSTRGSLSNFNGSNPNGTWTIFFADESAGEQSTLLGWSLDITDVPELPNVALIIFGTLAAARCLKRFWNSMEVRSFCSFLAGWFMRSVEKVVPGDSF